MILYPICSSSRGNCLYISGKRGGILVDAGFGVRNLFTYLKNAQISPIGIKSIFITHEHIDHTLGLYSITKNLCVSIFSSKETLKCLVSKGRIHPSSKLYEIDSKKVCVCGLEIGAFKTPHDCARSLGFCIFDGQKKLSICTDAGHITDEMKQNLKDSTLVFLESNYDRQMLLNSHYPYYIKKRIESKLGHLSNDDATEFIKYLIDHNVKKFILGHLSQNNNTPEVAFQTATSRLLKSKLKINQDYSLNIAPVRNPDKIYEV